MFRLYNTEKRHSITQYNTKLNTKHKQGPGQKPMWPKHESVGSQKVQGSAQLKYMHIPSRSSLIEHN